MLIGWLRFFRGNVKFSAQTGSPELFLDFVFQKKIRIRNLNLTNDMNLTGEVAPKDYACLAQCAKLSSTKLRLKEKRGFPFFAHRYRKRWGILVGLLFFISSLLWSQNFVWSIDFPEYDAKKQNYLVELMKEEGIYIGAFKPNLNIKYIQERVLHKSSELAWVAFNMHGTTMHVALKQKVENPMTDLSVPCNVVARKNGQIIKVDALRGVKTVLPNEIVLAGEMVISSATIGLNGTTKWVHADGVVLAETFTSKTFFVNLNRTEKKYTGKKANRYWADFAGFKIPLFFDLPFTEENDVTETKIPLHLFEKDMPFGLEKESHEFYEEQNTTLTQEQGLEELYENFKIYEQTELKDTKIISSEDIVKLEGDLLTVTRHYTCEEDIAQKIAISVND